MNLNRLVRVKNFDIGDYLLLFGSNFKIARTIYIP